MKRRKVQLQNKIGAAFIAIILLFLAMAPLTGKAADAKGTLNLHKLSSVGVVEGKKVPEKEYYKVGELYHEYVAGAEYSLYRIGSFEQTVVDGTASMSYKPIEGLKNISGESIEKIDGSLAANSIDANTAGTPIGKYKTGNGALVINDLDIYSVYLIKETITPVGVKAGNDFIITIPMYDKGTQEWSYKVDAFPKNVINLPSIKKSITNDGTEGMIYYANVGDAINYKVTVTAPADIDDADGGFYEVFKIVDSYSKNLLINDNTTFNIAGTRYKDNEPYELLETDYSFTYNTETGEMVIALTEAGIEKVDNNDTLEITYEAKITGAIDTRSGGIVNSAKLILNDDTTETKEPDPIVYIYSYGVKKVDEDNKDLGGAAFVLATTNGTEYTYLNFDKDTSEWKSAADKSAATTFTTSTTGSDMDSEAILQFLNLEENTTYYLFEVSSPEGYQTLVNPIEIEASFDTTNAVYASYNSEGDYQIGAAGSIGYTTNVQNILESDYPGSLPSTGGSGIYIFIIIGAAIISLALLLLVKSKKNNNKAD